MLKTIKTENTEPLTPQSRGEGAAYDGQLCSYSEESLVDSYSALPAHRERLGTLGSLLTSAVPYKPGQWGSAAMGWEGIATGLH